MRAREAGAPMSRRRPPRVPPTRKGGVLFVLPSIDDELPTEMKNSIAVRNQANVELRCPDCGAEPEFHLDDHGMGHLVFWHEEWCTVVPSREES
jgi:hypothetical protein